MQHKLLTIFLFCFTLLITQFAYAGMPPKPKQCPAASTLRARGIDLVTENDGMWLAGVLSNDYGTKNDWTFVMGDIQASSEAEAREEALAALETISFEQGPVPVPQYKVWACTYQTTQGYRSIAITPPMSLSKSIINASFHLTA